MQVLFIHKSMACIPVKHVLRKFKDALQGIIDPLVASRRPLDSHRRARVAPFRRARLRFALRWGVSARCCLACCPIAPGALGVTVVSRARIRRVFSLFSLQSRVCTLAPSLRHAVARCVQLAPPGAGVGGERRSVRAGSALQRRLRSAARAQTWIHAANQQHQTRRAHHRAISVCTRQSTGGKLFSALSQIGTMVAPSACLSIDRTACIPRSSRVEQHCRSALG